jgi:DNA-binding IclR family transcriptional regulator
VRELFSGPLQAVSVRAPRSVEDLLARLGAVRRHGFAEADDKANRGVGTVAVAIADAAAQETVSACITFSLSIVSAEERAAIRDALVAGAAEIGRRFNDPFWIPPPGLPTGARPTAA